MRRIETIADVHEALDALCALDSRLVPVRVRAGDVPLRRTEPGFASLVSIVVSQQVSVASAAAILGRLTALCDPLTAQAIHAADDSLFREAGLSRPKQKTLRAIAAASMAGELDLDALCRLDAGEAIARMTAVHGIGRWTAEIYLLFSAGYPDIFPARDVALQSAVGHALGIVPRPAAARLAGLAESWAPHRGTAARLFWAYYRSMKGREGVTLT
ncbi:DNA-3-methyladenine glycosylase 2 family protein [Aquibium carbonis]|uniref:DNA-3-methyladenine glycosylase II n=1 Tax=Aquibium carbonis TaxID=2495581 RepID=A0A3S0G8G6_9HYPH|nr:DNA-3-methyladenine glycosylase [Aquibium carbonis]RST86139.1 DNA-3-methyladenine glycosylase 2 family protein [Aquibium carbonis]